MSRPVKRSYKYRFYPTPEQTDLLIRTFGCVRLVWNKALEGRTRLYRDTGMAPNYVETAHWLTAWKKDPELGFLSDVSNVPLQQTLRHLQGAFSRYFTKQARYPRFKNRHKSRASATFQTNAFRFRDGRLFLAKMTEPLDLIWSRPLPEGAEPSTVTVTRDSADRWFVSMVVETQITPLPRATQDVGIDAGLSALATLSTGLKITNLRHERRDRGKLAKAQRALARKTKGSNNRAKARIKVARVHARITDRRTDYLHKVTTSIVRENQTIAIEDLAVRNMVKTHSLARAISDAAWRQLRFMLEYKAAWYGRTLRVVDRWFPSSKLCSTPQCGYSNRAMPLNVRSWTCPRCGAVHDRDVNAAKNILAAGLAES